MTLQASDFDYPLDPDLIAQHPLARRDQSRLMTLDRATGRTRLGVFADLPSLLRSGDLMVVNDTRVIPAKFFCRRATGGRLEGLFLRQHQSGAGGGGIGAAGGDGEAGTHAPAGRAAPDDAGRWVVLLKGAGRCKPGERLELLDGGGVQLELIENQGKGQWLVAADPPAPAAEVLAVAGHTPLPPYIRRPAPAAEGAAAEDRADRDRYQTVYAATDGAVAAPTAGLHFTPEILAALAGLGVETASVTLHVGLGTFSPVKVEDLAEHPMHSEWYEMSASTAAAINAAREAHRRIVAVGTTSVRVLESVVSPQGRFEPASGVTDIFLYPPAEFRATDALITNFHLPRSTLLMLVAAFCSPGKTDGIEMILAAYGRAVAERLRFFSYGDAMLIE